MIKDTADARLKSSSDTTHGLKIECEKEQRHQDSMKPFREHRERMKMSSALLKTG